MILSFEEAISKVSELMTIRQGDLIFIDLDESSHKIQGEEIIVKTFEGNELLYCKIK